MALRWQVPGSMYRQRISESQAGADFEKSTRASHNSMHRLTELWPTISSNHSTTLEKKLNVDELRIVEVGDRTRMHTLLGTKRYLCGDVADYRSYRGDQQPGERRCNPAASHDDNRSNLFVGKVAPPHLAMPDLNRASLH
jgi:hypothetical protein